MKNLVVFLSAVLVSVSLFAQVPNKMSFQMVVRNNLGKLVTNKNCGIQVTILKSTTSGTAEYIENHTITSNVNGLITFDIGTGTVKSGSFSTINWSLGPYFLKTEIDLNGGTNYTISGVTEFVSVPYANLADNVKNLSNGSNFGEMNYWNGSKWVPFTKGAHGQTLTFCGGKPTWTVGGICPGTISTLNCSNTNDSGFLIETNAANEVTSTIEYSGGNGGPHNGQVVTSSGVIGLTATLQAGNFVNGTGSLTYTISGTPLSSGIANFAINIGTLTCTLSRNIEKILGTYGPTIYDVDGNAYKTVIIGTQQWMGENLKVSKYNDGIPIQNVSDSLQWQNQNSGAWTYYQNNIMNNDKYGKLYNWFAVNPTTNGYRNICPMGWHIPSDAEWNVLADYLGGVSVAGGKMKEVGTVNWLSPNNSASNLSLFTAVAGGSRNSDSRYLSLGNTAFWWTATEVSTSAEHVWNRYISQSDSQISSFGVYKTAGYSVRCVKD
jgi:uncharacterized protein (TIGR02145 family)